MKTLVFLSGTMCDARLFAPQIEYFRAAGWQVQTPQITAQPPQLADFAANLLTRLPQRFALAGLSLGGVVALELLRQAPERMTRLALLDSNDAADSAAACARREADFQRAQTIGLARFMQDEMLPRYLHKANLSREDLRRVVVDMALDAGMARWRRQLTLLTTRRDARALLAQRRVPTLFVCGADDVICPPELHRQMAEAAAGRWRIVPNSGHLPTLEAPQQTTDALADFFI